MDRITEESLCSLQAQVHVQEVVLRALVATHPNPSALLAAWQQCLADAGSGPIAANARDSAYLAEHCRVRAEDWTAELVELTLPSLASDETVVSGGDGISLQGARG
jgi:hypothetical protein